MDAPSIQYARTTDGADIAFTSVGDGPVLVYESPPTSKHLQYEWPVSEGVQEPLAATFQVVSLDHRGSGLSAHTPGRYAAEDLALDIEAVLDAVAAETCVMVTTQHCPQPGLALALKHPQRVEKIVLVAPFIRMSDYHATPAIQALHTLRALDPDRGLDAQIGYLTGLRAQSLDALLPMAQASWAAQDPGLTEALKDYDLSDRLSEIVQPTLVLQPSSRALSGPEFAREAAARIPNATLKMLHTASTYFYITEPDLLVEEILQFTRGASGRVRGTNLTHTLMFTDLAASTATTQRLGDAAAQDLVRAHNEIVRTALDAHDGHEIKHTGDGIFAWFPAASSGLDCAQAIQQGVADLANPDLGVKIGLNAGEPIAEEDDLYGTAVQIAARVTDQAAAGEIVCTDVVRLLVAGKAYLFSEREPAALKGVEEPVRLFTLGDDT